MSLPAVTPPPAMPPQSPVVADLPQRVPSLPRTLEPTRPVDSIPGTQVYRLPEQTPRTPDPAPPGPGAAMGGAASMRSEPATRPEPVARSEPLMRSEPATRSEAVTRTEPLTRSEPVTRIEPPARAEPPARSAPAAESSLPVGEASGSASAPAQ
jgi:hypothetical protein